MVLCSLIGKSFKALKTFYSLANHEQKTNPMRQLFRNPGNSKGFSKHQNEFIKSIWIPKQNIPGILRIKSVFAKFKILKKSIYDTHAYTKSIRETQESQENISDTWESQELIHVNQEYWKK